MKKILFIHHSGLIGGGSVSFINTLFELNKKYEVISCIPDDPLDLLMYLRELGIEPKSFSFRLGKLTYYSGGNNLLNFKFWYHALHSIFQISYWKKVIRAENPDLIIVNSKVLCWMGKIFKRMEIPSICFVRETIYGKPDNSMNKIMSKMLDDFTLVSFISSYDLKQTNLVKAKTIVSNDVIEIEQYMDKLGKVQACKQLGIPFEPFNVLFVGGIDMLKGIDIAVKSMTFLKDKNINLIVAGKDTGDMASKNKRSIKFSKEIKDYINRENLESKIKFIGILTDMSIPFSACDILIFPMKEPHQSRPAFEIGAQRKPVIISDFPNIREFIVDGVNGLTFKPKDPEDLAKAILRFSEDNEFRDRAGLLNYEHAVKNHTKENSMHELMQEIDKILNEQAKEQ